MEGGKKLRKSQQKSVCGEREREREVVNERKLPLGFCFFFPPSNELIWDGLLSTYACIQPKKKKCMHVNMDNVVYKSNYFNLFLLLQHIIEGSWNEFIILIFISFILRAIF